MKQIIELLAGAVPMAAIVIMIARWILRTHTFYRSVQSIRLILLLQTGINILTTAFYVISRTNNGFDRVTGPYALAYWFMFVSSTLLPLFLIHHKIGTSLLALFVVSIFMNIGRIFESFVIMTTSLHRDYAYLSLPWQEIQTFSSGLLLGIMMVAIEIVFNKRALRMANRLKK